MNSIKFFYDDVISDVAADQFRLRFSIFRTCEYNNLKLGYELADRTESRVLDMDFTCIEVFFNATFL